MPKAVSVKNYPKMENFGTISVIVLTLQQ